VNNQWTIGAISKLRKEFPSGVNAEVGLDWRTASIDHYRDVRDLLGGQFFVDDANEFVGDRNATFGDKIDYDNTNDVDWIGGYVQAEKTSVDGSSLYGMLGVAQNAYSYTDHFRRDPDNTSEKLKLESGNLTGFQAKGGVNRVLNEEWSVFGNAGYVSKVPIFDGVIDDGNGVVNPDPKNEKFLSFEGGVSYRALDRALSLDLNLYHTTWRDRTYNLFVRNITGAGEDGVVSLLGVDARHMGVELQSAYQPNDFLRFDVAASFGDWKYLNDVTGRFSSEDNTTTVEAPLYIKDLKVADQPQTQLAYAASVYPVGGLWLQVQGRSNFNYYAAFSPDDREDPEDRAQPWKTPGYTVFDFHGSYRLTDLIPAWRGGDVRLFANVFNLFDTTYVQDATDNSSFNAFNDDGVHDASSAEVYLGLPRTFNVGFQVIF
jgi:outer membrane receptor protein involved in Fe transport